MSCRKRFARYPRPRPRPPLLEPPPLQGRAAPGRSRWSRRLALAAALALLGPGLAIGALLHVNDILSADLLPGTLFLQEGPTNQTDAMASMALTAAAPPHQDTKPYGGNWSDAFMTMNFHR